MKISTTQSYYYDTPLLNLIYLTIYLTISPMHPDEILHVSDMSSPHIATCTFSTSLRLPPPGIYNPRRRRHYYSPSRGHHYNGTHRPSPRLLPLQLLHHYFYSLGFFFFSFFFQHPITKTLVIYSNTETFALIRPIHFRLTLYTWVNGRV